MGFLYLLKLKPHISKDLFKQVYIKLCFITFMNESLFHPSVYYSNISTLEKFSIHALCKKKKLCLVILYTCSLPDDLFHNYINDYIFVNVTSPKEHRYIGCVSLSLLLFWIKTTYLVNRGFTALSTRLGISDT